VEAMLEQVALSPEPHYRLNVSMMRLPALMRFSTPARDSLDGELASMRADADAAGCDRCWYQYVQLAAEAHARSGDLAAAAKLLDEWEAGRPRPRPGPAARHAYVRALVAGDDLGLFEQAAELATGAGQHLLRLWIELDAALARSDALALRSVAESAQAMGAFSEGELAVSRLRELGVRWRPPAPMENGTLSARERQIAEMVASGASNPEIAASLFLSRKTVERHVTHILAKLGARNRVELAGRLKVGS
jgi:DNA-binding CsgD family transcriptional regulator